MAYSRYIPEIKDKDGNIYGVMDKEARASLDRKYEKPSAGIPASDIASGVIPDVPDWAKAAQKPSYTAAEVGATTEQEVSDMIASAIGDIHSFELEIVQELPATNIKTHTIYLLPKTGETNDIYDEYAYINNSWEMIGNTQIDLSGYALKSELPKKVSDLNNDAGYLTQHQDISGKANSADLSAVATSGNYDDLSNKPVIPNVPVQDVQVNGVSVLNGSTANIPIVQNSSTAPAGVVKINWGGLDVNDGFLKVNPASIAEIKNGSSTYTPITPNRNHHAAFYGLAKAAGADMAQSSNSVGTYTSEAKAAIQSMLGVSDLIATAENNLVASKAYFVGDVFTANGKLYKATAAIAQDAAIIPSVVGEEISGANCVETNLANENIKDVQINGTSIVQNGVANIPVVTPNGSVALGLVKPTVGLGTGVASNGGLAIVKAEDNNIKNGADEYRPIVPKKQHISAFYGLAKAAGANMASSSNEVGTYTDEAKQAIQTMLGIDLSSIASQVEIPLVETVDGAAVTITGQPNTRYMCGEVTSISITPPAAGSIDVVFTSGSTVAVLTLPSTVKMPEWFDASTLDTNTIYEILITDGVYGSVMTWAT